MDEQFPKVQGECIMCHKESLFLGEGGFVTCATSDCEQPDATSELISKRSLTSKVRVKEVRERGPRWQKSTGGFTPPVEETVVCENAFGVRVGAFGIDEMQFGSRVGKNHVGDQFLVTFHLIPKEG
jgi:hypothetical protein